MVKSPGRKNCLFFLCGIIGVAFVLRVFSIADELPNHYYIDENNYVYMALRFGTGDLNPHEFINPAFFQYILFFLYGVYFLIGKAFTVFKSSSDFLLFYLTDPTNFFLIGRFFSAAVGSLTCFLIYRILRKTTRDVRFALLGGLAYACLPFCVKYAHFATVETLLVFLILLSFYFFISFIQERRISFFYLGSFFIGLACGTKYSAFILFVVFLVSFFYGNSAQKRLVTFSLGLIAVFFGFFISSPYCILDFSSFIRDMRSQAIAMTTGYWGWEEGAHTYWHQLSINIRYGMGLFLELAAFAGIILSVFRRQREDILILSFVLPFYIWIGKNVLTYERFVLPLFPFLLILGIHFFAWFQRRWFAILRIGSIPFLSCVILISVAKEIYIIKREFFLPATFTLARQWCEDRILPGSRILVDTLCPQLQQNTISLERYHRWKHEGVREEFSYREHRSSYFALQNEAARRKPITYDITYIPHPAAYLPGEREYFETWMNLDRARAIVDPYRYDYVIVNTEFLSHYIGKEKLPKKFKFMADFYQQVANECIRIGEFADRGASIGSTIWIFEVPKRRLAGIELSVRKYSTK